MTQPRHLSDLNSDNLSGARTMRRLVALLVILALVPLASCGRSRGRTPAGTATVSSYWTVQPDDAEEVPFATITPRPPATATSILPELMPTHGVVASMADAPPVTDTPASPSTVTPTPTATPTATVTNTPEPLLGTVNGDLVNVRSGPDTGHPLVGRVAIGDELEILARTEANEGPAWFEICCVDGGSLGWIRSDLIDLDAGTVDADVALAIDPPTPPAPGAQAGSPADAPPRAAAPISSAPPLPPGASGAPAVNPYTGLGGGNLGRRPVFVCINNDVAARPQYGLAQADIVYEYVMEGRAITRYSALFWSQDVARIGPVRSARLINVQGPQLYQTALLCSGASSGVRYILKHQVNFPYLDVDLDDPGNNVYSMSIGNDYRTRLQTSSGRLDRFLSDWNVNRIPSTRGLLFGDYGGGTPATRVDIPYPSLSRTSWVWNGNQWARLGRDGTPYVDAGSGGQITADNVVIQWAPHLATDIVEDSLGTTSIRIELMGSGPVKILRDGKVIDGTWRADDVNQPPLFFDAGGAPIPLHPGRTWFQIVEPHYSVTVG